MKTSLPDHLALTRCSSKPPPGFLISVCDMHLMKSLITPFWRECYQINAGGCCFIHGLRLGLFEVAGRVRGRGRGRGEVMNVLFKKLGTQSSGVGPWGSARSLQESTFKCPQWSVLCLCVHWTSRSGGRYGLKLISRYFSLSRFSGENPVLSPSILHLPLVLSYTAWQR